MDSSVIRGFLVGLFVVALTGCADSDRLGADGKPQAAGAQEVRQAVRAYTSSAPVRRVGQYSQAVAQGLFDPMLEGANQRAAVSRAAAHHMSPARPLADDERCVGSSIVRVAIVGKVPTYTQVLQGGRPIYCAGGTY